MALKRNYKGIEGYFYNSGNKKLTVEPGVIDKCWYQNVNDERVLNVGFLKNNHTSSCLEFREKEDIAALLQDFDVAGIRKLMRLPIQERLVLVYNHGGWNYGISLNRGHVDSKPRV